METEIISGCQEQARIILPWGGRLLNYCPVHANQIVMVGNAMGSPVQAQRMPLTPFVKCQSNEVLSEEESVMNKLFPATT